MPSVQASLALGCHRNAYLTDTHKFAERDTAH